MLFYKAWRESRVRFLFAGAVVVVFSLSVLLRARTGFPLPQNPRVTYSAFIWSEFYGQWRAVAFSVLALVLGLGGLQRERAAGTVGFTLALPVGRVRVLAVRAVTGLTEMAALALIPALIVPTLSPVIARHSYPMLQGLRFAVLFMSWGAVWFSIGFMWSVLFSGEYTAAVVSLLTPIAYMVVYANVSSGGRQFPSANPIAFMSGADAIANGGSMLLGPLPWTEIAVLACIATALFASAAAITARQSF